MVQKFLIFAALVAQVTQGAQPIAVIVAGSEDPHHLANACTAHQTIFKTGFSKVILLANIRDDSTLTNWYGVDYKTACKAEANPATMPNFRRKMMSNINDADTDVVLMMFGYGGYQVFDFPYRKPSDTGQADWHLYEQTEATDSYDYSKSYKALVKGPIGNEDTDGEEVSRDPNFTWSMSEILNAIKFKSLTIYADFQDADTMFADILPAKSVAIVSSTHTAIQCPPTFDACRGTAFGRLFIETFATKLTDQIGMMEENDSVEGVQVLNAKTGRPLEEALLWSQFDFRFSANGGSCGGCPSDGGGFCKNCNVCPVMSVELCKAYYKNPMPAELNGLSRGRQVLSLGEPEMNERTSADESFEKILGCDREDDDDPEKALGKACLEDYITGDIDMPDDPHTMACHKKAIDAISYCDKFTPYSLRYSKGLAILCGTQDDYAKPGNPIRFVKMLIEGNYVATIDGSEIKCDTDLYDNNSALASSISLVGLVVAVVIIILGYVLDYGKPNQSRIRKKSRS